MKRTALSIGAAAALLVAAPATLAQSNVGYIQLKGSYPERQTTPRLFQSPGEDDTFRQLVEQVRYASQRKTPLDGLVIRDAGAVLATAHIEELGEAIRVAQEQGVRVHYFTEIYGPAQMMLASYADEAIIQSGGGLTLPGMYMEEMFLADALGSVGVEPDFVQIGDYKGAEEMFVNSAPSEAWEENISQLVDSLYDHLTTTIASGRSMSVEQLEAVMSQAFYASDTMALEAGLVDASVDRAELESHIEKSYGGRFRWDSKLSPYASAGPDYSSMGFFEAFNELMMMMQPALQTTRRETIAVVHIDGAIVDGESTPVTILGGAGVGSLTIRKHLTDIQNDPNVKGVIVRINSPGGSAIASESIWIGLKRLAEKMPVWISVGDMAASGGYYIAVGGDKIYADPSSILGSIGVVGGKFALQGLYEKLNINVVPRARGPLGGVMSPLQPWTESERDVVRARMTETYDLFASRVEAGRPGIDLSKVGEGRLFTGDKAVELGMADEIGGLATAIADLGAKLGMTRDAFDVVDYPPPPSIEEYLAEALPFSMQAGSQSSLPGTLALLRQAMGEQAWTQFRDALGAMMLLRDESVVLVCPRILIRR